MAPNYYSKGHLLPLPMLFSQAVPLRLKHLFCLVASLPRYMKPLVSFLGRTYLEFLMLQSIFFSTIITVLEYKTAFKFILYLNASYLRTVIRPYSSASCSRKLSGTSEILNKLR